MNGQIDLNFDDPIGVSCIKPSDIPICDGCDAAVRFGLMGKMQYGEIALEFLMASQMPESNNEWQPMDFGILLRVYQEYAVTMMKEGWIVVDKGQAYLTSKAHKLMQECIM